MSATLYAQIDLADVIAPKHWDFAPIRSLLQRRYSYVIDVSEYEAMDWDSTLGEWAPTLGGWFVAISRDLLSSEGLFPNQWEQLCFDLPGNLASREFDSGSLDEMIALALQAKASFEEYGCSAVVVFRPGPHWLRSRQRSGQPYSRRSPGSAA